MLLLLKNDEKKRLPLCPEILEQALERFVVVGLLGEVGYVVRADFCRWDDDQAYRRAFERLLNSLQAS